MSTATPQPQNIILINANVITLDPGCPAAEWVAISGGTIRAVGTESDLKKFLFHDFEVIDCRGLTVLPGFNDAHLHLRAFAESLVTLDLRPSQGFKSIGDIKRAIGELHSNRAPGTWIRGRGYNEFYLAEKRHPNRWDLDEAAPDIPVKLTHRSGHAHVLNSLALKLVGISMKTEEPPQGLIDRDINTGEPTGLLYEMGEFLSKRVPPLDSKELLKGVDMADRELLSLGITSVQDASHLNDMERCKEIRSWKEAGLFRPRVNLMLNHTCAEQSETEGFSSGVGENQLRLSGIKIILDETTGRLHPPQEELNRTVSRIHRSGSQVAIHAVEEPTVRSACHAIEVALRKYPRSDHRHRIEHGSVCSPVLSKRLASLGIMVVTQPAFLYYNGDRYLRTVPGEQLRHLYALRTLMNDGVVVAASSDCPIVPPNPLIGIYSAITRMSETGESVSAEEAITPLNALRMYTCHGAKASFQENIKGSIRAGKLADLVALKGNPLVAPPDEIKDMDVEMTMINGEVVWEKQF
ncbi:MAG: amidohydrolase [Pseudomonadota bacterium]